ncbi:MAG: flagellar basal body rod protein FlgC [Alphaproteobacteria bacterium]
MSSVFDIAVSGLRAQSQRLAVSADNVANMLSLGVHPDPQLARPEGFAPQRTVFSSQAQAGNRGGSGVVASTAPIAPAAFLSLQPDHPDADSDGLVPLPNVLLEREVVEQIQALRLFQANIATIQTQDRMLGALLDIVS